jgi:rare lipoprotein A
MRGTVRMGSAVLLVALAALTALPAHAQQSVSATETATPGATGPGIPFAGISADISRVTGELDEATARSLELETEIEALEAERAALEERLAVTAERIREQRAELRAAEERLGAARERYRARLIEVYKRGAINPITLLFSSDTLTELVSRAGILTRIAEDDSRVVSDLTVAAADARYQATALEDLLAQDKQLQAAQRERIASLEKALDEQEALVAKLTVEAREALLKARRFTAETRAQWRAASIPIGTDIPRATAMVEPYAGLTYAISAYMPRTYRTTGRSWTAVASWYGPGFNGRNTASGQVFNEDDYTCASRTLPFGTVLALTRGGRRVIVYVNDRGPFIAGRDLDLSKAAAQALGFGGVASLHAEIVVPVTE